MHIPYNQIILSVLFLGIYWLGIISFLSPNLSSWHLNMITNEKLQTNQCWWQKELDWNSIFSLTPIFTRQGIVIWYPKLCCNSKVGLADAQTLIWYYLPTNQSTIHYMCIQFSLSHQQRACFVYAMRDFL